MVHKCLPLIVGVIAALSMFVTFFLIQFVPESIAKKAAAAAGGRRWITFSPPRKARNEIGNVVTELGQVDFEPRQTHYMKCAEVLVALSSASLLFMPTIHTDIPIRWMAFSLVLLGFTVVYAILFMALLSFSYEQFLYDPETYTIARSAINYALGFGALSCFALAYLSLSITLSWFVLSGHPLLKV